MEFIADIGTGMSWFIFWMSSFLTDDQAPGLVSIGILIWLLIAVMMVGAKNKDEFSAKVNAISREARKVANRNGYASVAAAWGEFRETLIEDRNATPSVLRNSVRPSSFFNLEDLHFGPGFSRYLPGLFVTVG